MIYRTAEAEPGMVVHARYERFLTGIGAGIILSGLVVLTGWAMDLPQWTRLFISTGTLAPNTALCFILSGISILLQQRRIPSLVSFARLIAALLLLFPLLTLAEYFLDTDLFIDYLLLGKSRALPEFRMAVFTSVSFILIAIPILFQGSRSRLFHFIRVFLLTVVLSYGLYNTLVSSLGIDFPGGTSSIYPPALGASVLFLLTSIGLILAENQGNWTSFSEFQLIFLGITITLFLVFQIEFLAYNRARHTVNLIRQVWETKHRQLVILALKEAVILNQDANRGYVLTSKQDLQVRALSSRREIQEGMRQVKLLLSGRPEVQEPLDSLEIYVQGRLLYVDELLQTYSNDGRDAASAMINQGRGGRLTDRIAVQVDRIYNTEEKLLTSLINQVVSDTNKMFQLIIVGVLLLFMILIAITYQTIRFIRSQQKWNAALSANHTLTRLAIENSHAGTWEWNYQKNAFVWSPELLLLFGLPPISDNDFETLLGQVHADDAAWVRKGFHDAFKRKSALSFEFRIIMPDLTLKWLKATGQYFERPNLFARYFGICFDITDVRNQEAEITANNYVLRMAGKTALFGVWSYDVQQNKIDWSDEARELFGAAASESPLSDEGWELPEPEYGEEFNRLINHSVQTGEPFDQTSRIRTLQGNPAWIRITGEAIRDRNGRVLKVLGSVQNVDKLKKTEEELRNAKKEADIANQAKSDFLLNVSHEFRTPLNAVIGYAGLMDVADAATRKEYAASIAESGRNLLAMVNDILELIRNEKGEIELETGFTDTRPLFTEIVESYRYRAQEKGLAFTFHYDNAIPAFLFLDAKRLTQIVTQLVDNAVKYTETGNVELKVYTLPSDASISRVTLEFEVTDTGRGIPEEFRRMLYNAFSQADRKTVLSGIGIGLALTKRFVDLMQGSIRVVSQPGMGSSFTVTIPDILFRETGKKPADEEAPKAVIDKVHQVEDISGLDALIAALRGTYAEVHSKLEHRQPLEEVKRFGSSLRDLGNAHHCSHIADYGSILLLAADRFDIETILRLIRSYDEHVSILEQLRNERV